MLRVCKFGGSSLSSKEQFLKVKNIVLNNLERKVVIVSAIGKRDKNDSKITDLLYILKAHLKYGVPYLDIFNLISKRFIDVKNELGINFPIEDALLKLKEELNKNIDEDYLVSRGEYLTANLMASYLGFDFVDAKDLIKFKYDGTLDEAKTEELIEKYASEHKYIVCPGFYGSYPNGKIHLLSRGGSDITGALFANAIKADIYENWTDVSGILAADPNIIKNPRSIPEITYEELRKLSYMGANVLHEETVFPVQRLNIPINIKNTNDPINPGTMISNTSSNMDHIITGISGKEGYTSITLSKLHSSNEIGFLKKILEIVESYNLNIEHVPSSIDSVSLVLEKSKLEHIKYELLSDLTRLGVSIREEDISLIAVVGKNMVNRSGISAKIFDILAHVGISIKMLSQDPTEVSIIIGVNPKDYVKAIKALYEGIVK